MSRAATSVFIHGLYSAGLSAVLLLAPSFLFGWVGLPSQRGVWVYTVALALAIVAYMDLGTARDEARLYYWVSIFQRCAVASALGALVYLGVARTSVMILAAPEALLAAWTLGALVMDGRMAAKETRLQTAAMAATAPGQVVAR